MADVQQTNAVGPVDDLRRLRERVAELETQLVTTEAWANQAVAEAQERTYWLDRWHLDLNSIMERPGADQFRASVRAVRGVYRFARRLQYSSHR